MVFEAGNCREITTAVTYRRARIQDTPIRVSPAGRRRSRSLPKQRIGAAPTHPGETEGE